MYFVLVEGDYEKCVINLYGLYVSWLKVCVVEKFDLLFIDLIDLFVGGVFVWEVGKVYNLGDKVSYKGVVY